MRFKTKIGDDHNQVDDQKTITKNLCKITYLDATLAVPEEPSEEEQNTAKFKQRENMQQKMNEWNLTHIIELETERKNVDFVDFLQRINFNALWIITRDQFERIPVEYQIRLAKNRVVLTPSFVSSFLWKQVAKTDTFYSFVFGDDKIRPKVKRFLNSLRWTKRAPARNVFGTGYACITSGVFGPYPSCVSC